MACNKCKLDKPIVNKHFGLCLECNNKRLYGNEYGKQYKFKQKPIKFSSAPKKPKFIGNKGKSKSKKSLFVQNLKEKEEKSMLERDELFYEECFNQSNHRCEECNAQLPELFRDSDGKVLARYRYSHIIPKSTAPELRHKVKNINHLCLKCHMEWENGDKKKMKIYPKNAKKFPQYF